MFEQVEAQVRSSVEWLRLLVETLGALVIAADILSTSVAPTWERIGKLAAIAVIRTALNYFLSKELKDEQASEEPALQRRPGPAGQG